jgi:RimJ/RimL family protein N-acetyltransferase
MRMERETVNLKRISQEDLGILVELLTDDTVKQTYMVPDFASPAEAAKLAQRLIDYSQEENLRTKGIYAGDQLIGILNQTEVMEDRIELGYAILPHYHNQGYGTEALRIAIGYCFDHGFREVLTGAFEENLASIRIMMKNGMQKLDRQDWIAYRGKTHMCVYYSICRNQQCCK